VNTLQTALRAPVFNGTSKPRLFGRCLRVLTSSRLSSYRSIVRAAEVGD
jgi:hypothetical protein